MATLILHNTDGFEMSRRDMHPAERLEVYRAKMDGTPLTFGTSRYRVLTVSWRIPQEECVAVVVFDSWEPTETPYEC